MFDISSHIDPYTLEIYETVSEAALALGINFFVVGATARDIIMEGIYDIKPFRATVDIDLGVQVKDWCEFAALKESFLRSGKFTETKQEERILYKGSHPIDIIPFGKVATSDNHIEWPPEHAVRMSIEGFQECYDNAIQIRLRTTPLLEIRVVTLAGLAILKILSWKERGVSEDKDAKDLLILLRNYAAAGNEDRLFGPDSDLMEQERFELESAGACLLGRDLTKICSGKIREILCDILKPEIDVDGDCRLATAMMKSRVGNDLENNMMFIRKLYAEIAESV